MKRRYKNVSIQRMRHGRAVYYYRVGKSRRIRLPDDYGSPHFTEAIELAKASGIATPPTPKPRDTFDYKRRQQVGAVLAKAVRAARSRAKRRNLEFDIDEAWVIERAENAKFKCNLSGIPFYADRDFRTRHPYAPSLDRIDSSRGYTKDNVRVIAYALNVMLLDWGVGVFERVANGYRSVKGTAPKLLFPHFFVRERRVRDGNEIVF